MAGRHQRLSQQPQAWLRPGNSALSGMAAAPDGGSTVATRLHQELDRPATTEIASASPFPRLFIEPAPDSITAFIASGPAVRPGSDFLGSTLVLKLLSRKRVDAAQYASTATVSATCGWRVEPPTAAAQCCDRFQRCPAGKIECPHSS